VKLLEKQDAELQRLNSELRSIVLPPMSPTEDPTSRVPAPVWSNALVTVVESTQNHGTITDAAITDNWLWRLVLQVQQLLIQAV